ncbi:zinc ribbon domain-containing protein [Nocardia sp. NPDC004340]|uniref:zinc ribbon domain-containing protein n=1 Tax=Nocardia sp. CA-136227 TaxID=3239979 RepID=UPI003D9803B7
MRVAVNPRLYDPLPDDPVLLGCECEACGRVYFPPIGLGCEMCGAGEGRLRSRALRAEGVVFAVAEVAVDPLGAAPFTVAEIVLDEGPLIRALTHPESHAPRIGDRVAARWHVVRRDDAELVEPAFATVPAESEVRP